MTAIYPVFLSAITLDSTNNRILIGESGFTGVGYVAADLTVGTYYLRGDGAAGDICAEIASKLNAATGAAGSTANTYTCAVSWNAVAGGKTAEVTIARSAGSATWQILWATGDFDSTILGYTAVDRGLSAGSDVNDFSPSCVWVADNVLAMRSHRDERDAKVNRTRNGSIYGFKRGGTYDVLELELQDIDDSRTFDWFNTSDPNGAFNSFLSLCSDGRAIEYHEGTTVSFTSQQLNPLSASTEVGSGWHFSQSDADEFEPTRLEPGLALYSWPVTLMGKV